MHLQGARIVEKCRQSETNLPGIEVMCIWHWVFCLLRWPSQFSGALILTLL
jgi:hypothetical protein